ncbi:MAG: hypothetical protein QOI92_442, partial [Chloroflexota bacterium]|nr:hypothetical protein [Chloroflexota bacterium]
SLATARRLPCHQLRTRAARHLLVVLGVSVWGADLGVDEGRQSRARCDATRRACVCPDPDAACRRRRPGRGRRPGARALVAGHAGRWADAERDRCSGLGHIRRSHRRPLSRARETAGLELTARAASSGQTKFGETVTALDTPLARKRRRPCQYMHLDTSPAGTTLGQTKFGETVTNVPQRFSPAVARAEDPDRLTALRVALEREDGAAADAVF